jgi:hypothetical protein
MTKKAPNRSHIEIGGARKSAELIMSWLAERGGTMS